MRVELLKNVKEKYISILREIVVYENKYGKTNYYSKLSDNGIAWRLEDLPISVSAQEINFLLKRGIVKKIKKGVYHIDGKIKDKLEEELKLIDVGVQSEINVEKSLHYVIRSGEDARAVLNILKFQKRWDSMYDDIGYPLSKIREIIINSGADLSLLSRLRESGLLSGKDEEYRFYIFSENVLDPYLESSFSTQDAVFEYMNVVRAMKRQYEYFISSLKENEIDEMLSQIRDVQDIVNYSKHVTDTLYMDILLPIIQQYGMADVPIYSSEGKKITQTGFSLAYFGEPGTGKTFATDDFIRGNERDGIPAHGIIGRIRYAEGMTPKKLISILEAYQNYPVDWIIPEFNDFFRYKGMVEKLKLVMEHREVSDETKKEVIKPYKVTSFFIVNYNTKFSKGKWSVTVDDPNFNAVEDRMICKVFVNDEKREKEIYRNMVRRVSGDIDWYLSEYLRKHITYSYHFFTKHNKKLILSTSDFVSFGNKIREMRRAKNIRISNRIIMKGIQIAGSAALIKGVGREDDEIRMGEEELLLALDFIDEEIKTRAMRI